MEESFSLYASNKEKAGEGCYVSATTSSNKRYYGVLVDQPSLKEASTMYFQDQSESLQLNERMKVLNQKREKLGGLMMDGIQQTSTDRLANGAHLTSPAEAAPATNGHVANGDFTRGRDISDTTALEPKTQMNATNLGITDEDHSQPKRLKLDHGVAPDSTKSSLPAASPVAIGSERPVQKFKYVDPAPSVTPRRTKVTECGYRVLVATFCSIDEAANGDSGKARSILTACEEGGNFLPDHKDDPYYYQYEVLPSSLSCNESDSAKIDMMRTSMGFNSFLQNTLLPAWFPLSNLHSQSKVLSMLNMKMDNKGNVKWEGVQKDDVRDDVNILAGGTKLSMQRRNSNQYQIGVIGGGIAGLSCCQELVSSLFNDGIDAKVTLIEARSRFGGRLFTDRSWKTEGQREFPLELGASWIHGIDHNPLAAVAESAGIEFVIASEEVKMLENGMKEVNAEMDDRMGKMFDDLLDHAAEDCWIASEAERNQFIQPLGGDPQAAVRWYASIFAQPEVRGANTNAKEASKLTKPSLVTPPSHRWSNDRSIDCAIGNAIANHRFREFSKLTKNEHRMLLWNTKNLEYALGANITDLSMKYWDADDRHAFEGDHVLLREGYSAVVDHMVETLHQCGSTRFEHLLNFPVGKVDYGRKSTTEAFGRDRFGRERHLTELSDSCSVTSEDGGQTRFFDFVVCAVPLGVLKESVERQHDVTSSNKLSFYPSLPFSKVDAITNVGFGLLNKVYLHFDTAFWRIAGVIRDEDPLQCLFGNVTGVNPHHYMFFDVGMLLGSREDRPPIIMSLISGREAVALECLSDAEIVDEVMVTLRQMFSNMTVPEPKAHKITRWGQDRFSRGSYTFLPPGATDQDFHLLQSPVNANGDSLLLEGSEIMRLFFAGEHTTALHPSMAHGALLSGIRAAQEVISALKGNNTDDRDIDKVIPLALFRHMNPSTPMQCNLCNRHGSHVREGTLLAFKRGARQVLVHNNCAEFSPEVEVVESKWKNVIRAVNRGKAFSCVLCSLTGATIGCASENCYRMYHFSCAEDSGWRFDRDGKHFFCDLHSIKAFTDLTTDCDRVSIPYFLAKNPGLAPAKIACSLCRMPDDTVFGQMLAFENGKKQILCVHEKCIKFTNLVDTSEREESRMGHEYNNVFQAVEDARICSICKTPGASIRCSQPNCDQIFHFHCGLNSGWKFEKNRMFLCKPHRITDAKTKTMTSAIDDDKAHNDQRSNSNGSGLIFKHNLLSRFGATANNGFRMDVPGNLDIGGTAEPDPGHDSPEKTRPEDSASDSENSFHVENGQGLEIMDISLSHEISGPKQLVRLERQSRDELWNLSLKVGAADGRKVVSVASAPASAMDPFALQANDVIVSINGSKVGSDGLKTLRDVLFYLKQEVDLMLQVIRRDI